jgi:hypothetical protein
MQIILNIPNQQDWALLLPLLERLNIRFEIANVSQPIEKQGVATKKMYHQAILARGGDVSYFGNAAELQREPVQERHLAFQNEPD